MRRLALSITIPILAAVSSLAQTFNISKGGVIYSFPASEVGTMQFGAGKTLTVLGKEFLLGDDTDMWVDDSEISPNLVTVKYSDSDAQVRIAGNIARYVDATVSDGNVVLTQSPDVSADNCGEITYRLSGKCNDGSLTLCGSYKATLELDNLDLTSTTGAPLDIQIGKRVAVKILAGMSNTIRDCASGTQKGCFVCKGHPEFKGEGSLNIFGNTAHAIYAKEYVEVSKCDLNIVSAVKDGINCNQYFLMKSGSLNIANVGDDGIQVSFKDDADREAEDTGSITVSGGTLNINVSADAAKGMKCEGPMLVSGGEIVAKVSGNGIWDSSKNKTKASACLGSDEDITITGGTMSLTATGGGGKGINCDGILTIDDGTMDIVTSGGVVAYVNGTLNNNYTGNTDRLDSDQKSSPKGIKADGNVNINGGTITVTTTGNGAEGIESKAILTVNGGEITVNATDDAINSAGNMYIKGGTITVISTGNDGLDSNGNLYLDGGYVMAFGARSPECGIDANEEEGYTVIFNGGTLLAVGGNNSVPSSTSGSIQPYVSASSTVKADNEVYLSDKDGNTLAVFKIPTNYTGTSGSGGNRPGGSSGSSVLITCPGLTTGSSYTLKSDTSTTSVTARTTGSGGNRPR